MDLYHQIKHYQPKNEQEEKDQAVMLQFIKTNDDYLLRSNKLAHFTASIWVINEDNTKTLMVYHHLYDSWSWIGGHADGNEDLKQVALKELQEETGIKNAKLISDEIYSLEILTVNGHMKKGEYVSSHLHFNITFLAKASELETLKVNKDENQGVCWFTFEEALKVSKEPWMIKNIYQKLISKVE